MKLFEYKRLNPVCFYLFIWNHAQIENVFLDSVLHRDLSNEFALGHAPRTLPRRPAQTEAYFEGQFNPDSTHFEQLIL